MSRLLTLLNNSGLAASLTELQAALLRGASKTLASYCPETTEMDRKASDAFALNTASAAQAEAAFDHATGRAIASGHLAPDRLNGSLVHNVRVVQNDLQGMPYESWSTSLREFLLPRSAYFDFDSLVDPRHNIDAECGYPRWITPSMYKYMYDRDDTACRVVDIYPDESWAVDPAVFETEDEEDWTEFESAWAELCVRHHALQYLYRLDKLCGVGHYGILLFGIDDGLDLSEPVEGVTEWNYQDSSLARPKHDLLFIRPFDEYLSFVQQYDIDPASPRYGQPVYYHLIFLDMTVSAAGASVGTRLSRRVHWTRVLHVADNAQTSLVFGRPRQQPIFNRLLDLRKVKGGSAEMFYKGAWPGISFEIDPKFVADDPDFDDESFKKEIADYANGLQRYLRLMGVKANSLAPSIADPDKHVRIQMEAIACHSGVPLRIFMGGEESRLASSEDKLTWNRRLGRRIKTFVEPCLVRAFIDRLILLGALPRPKGEAKKKSKKLPPQPGGYTVGWQDLNTATDEDKANLALKWTQALSQYVASGVVHLIRPMDYLTMILGLRPSDARKVVTQMEADGGLAKLQKVDPSQGAGVNGKRENIAKGEDGQARGRPEPRDTADKKAEGTAS